ncbi:hypothetical protein D3C80_2006890 [compost metagenome]
MPSSLTHRHNSPSSRRRLTCTLCAPAWRMMLVSASWRMRNRPMALASLSFGRFSGTSTMHGIWVRASKRRTCHSMAEAMPASRIGGRRAVATSRTS